MRFSRYLMGLLSCLAAAAALTACGGGEELTCGPGTQAHHGECALTDEGCADGTVLAEDGTCVPEGGACADGTTFDAELGKCIVNTEIACGEGTIAEDGVCVVEVPTTCGPNTERDANSGECVLTDTACTTGTAYDADSDSCVPTDDVCAEGTHFSVDEAVCMPDAQCQEGDILLNGLCATHAEKLASTADHTEAQPVSEPTDVTLKPVGEQYVFTGTIAAPADSDADGAIDQDADVYNFSADAGTWMELALQSTGMPAPGFKLESADGTWVRYSPFDTSAARQVMLPKTGDYILTILPSIVLQSDGAVGPVGGDDWEYVGTIEQIDGPTNVTQGDMLTTGINGEFTTLTDNFFEITDLPSDGLLEVHFAELSDDIDAEIVVWGDDAEAFYNFPVSSSGHAYIKVPAANSMHVLVDYVRKRGGQDTFHTGVAAILPTAPAGPVAADSENTTTATTVSANDKLYVTFQGTAGQFIEIGHDNANGVDAEMTLYASDGTTLIPAEIVSPASKEFASSRALYHYTTQAHRYYIVEVAAAFGDDLTDESVTVSSDAPIDLGTINIGDTPSYTSTEAMSRGFKDWGFFELPAETKLSLSTQVPDGGRINLNLFNADGERIGIMHDDQNRVLDAGSYTFSVAPSGSDVSGYEFTLTASLPPVSEVEPNDTIADATAVNVGRDISGDLPGGDVDTWQFDLAQDMLPDEVFLVGIEHFLGGGWISQKPYTCRLLDSTGAELISKVETYKGCAMVTSGLTAGTYFIEVSNPTGDLHRYKGSLQILTGTMLAEVNDTTATATTTTFAEMTAGETGPHFYGDISSGTDVDYLEFTVATQPAADKALVMYVVGYTDRPAMLEYAIEDASGTELAGGLAFQAPFAVDSAALPPGTYYVKVSWPNYSSGSTTAYSLFGAIETPPGPGK